MRFADESAAKSAIGAGDDIFPADNLGVANDPVGNDLRMLHDIRCVADHAGDQKLAGRQRDFFPHPPLVFVPGVAGLDGIGASIDAQHEIDDVRQWNVGRMRAMPASPADVEADALRGSPRNA